MKLVGNKIKDDLLDFSVILETTINDAKIFLAEISRVYNKIGKQFPIIESEMQNENKDAILIIEYFMKGSVSKGRARNGLAKVLLRNQEEFFHSLSNMQLFVERDNIFSDSVVDGISKVNKIIDAIEQIRLLADQIKIYSLNAIITSSKYGRAGKAFGEISKNIIRLSDDSNHQAGAMSEKGKQLFTGFDDFKNHIININSLQRRDLETTKENMKLEFERISDTFNVFAEQISDIIENVEKSRYIIFDIMSILQREDIIRQQTEHIIESIVTIVNENQNFIVKYKTYLQEYKSEKEFPQDIETELEHSLLDLFTFNDAILNIIVGNFDIIQKEIIESNDSIKSFLVKMKNMIIDINESKDIIIDYFTGGEYSHTFDFSVIDSLFNSYLSQMKEYVGKIYVLLEKKNSVANKNIELVDVIDMLEEMFIDTKNIAKTFNSINFLAKIELEKNATIFQDSQAFSIQNVEAIASNISDTIQSCLVDFKGIKEDLFSSIEIFKENIESQSKEYRFILENTNKITDKLDSSKKIIRNDVKSLEKYLDKLMILIDNTLIDIRGLDELLSEINGISYICKEIGEMMRTRKREYYAEKNITSWVLESDKFLDILNQYTMQKERDIANSVFGEKGIDINVGPHSGEFTLF